MVGSANIVMVNERLYDEKFGTQFCLSHIKNKRRITADKNTVPGMRNETNN
jgi:hypothetical protein